MEVLFIELWRSKNYHLFFTLNGNLAGYKIIFWPFPEDSKDMLPLYCSSDCLREKPKGRLTFYFCRWVDFLSLAIGDCHFSKQMGLKSRNHFIRGCFFLWYCSHNTTSWCCGTWWVWGWDLQPRNSCSHLALMLTSSVDLLQKVCFLNCKKWR